MTNKTGLMRRLKGAMLKSMHGMITCREFEDFVLSYLDGEVFNLINGRVLPGEDIAGRVVDNLEHLFGILTASQHNGLELSDDSGGPEVTTYPKLEV